jgi:hypothetical protein
MCGGEKRGNTRALASPGQVARVHDVRVEWSAKIGSMQPPFAVLFCCKFGFVFVLETFQKIRCVQTA